MSRGTIVGFKDVRIFPTIGIVEIDFIAEHGKTGKMRFALRGLDKIVQGLLLVIEDTEKFSAEKGKAFTMTLDDIAGPIQRVAGTRTLPRPDEGGVIVQLIPEPLGLTNYFLPLDKAESLLHQLQQSTADTDALRKPRQ